MISESEEVVEIAMEWIAEHPSDRYCAGEPLFMADQPHFFSGVDEFEREWKQTTVLTIYCVKSEGPQGLGAKPGGW